MHKKLSSISKSHKLRTVIASMFVLSVAVLMLFFYWSLRPVARLRFTHLVDSYVLPINYKDLKVQQIDRSKKAQEIPVLLYHGILASKDDGFSITKEKFTDQMIGLKKQGFNTISMQQYIDFLDGKIDLPEKSFLLTFDDGRKDSYFRGDGILKALNFKATMFLATGYSLVDGSNYYLDKREVKRMFASNRWEVQSHSNYAGTNQISTDSNGTMMNFYGNLMWHKELDRQENLDEYRSRVKTEMGLVKSRIEGHLGQGTVLTLSFPFGDYAQANSNTQLTKILISEAKLLYQQVFVQFRKGDPYSSNYKGTNGFISRRIEVNPKLSGTELANQLISSSAKPLPYSAAFSEGEGWQSNWGTIKISNGQSVSLTTLASGSSAEAYLDGTRHKSYKTNIDFETIEDNTVVKILALNEDGKNHVACNFGANEVKIEQVSNNGDKVQLAIVKYAYENGKRRRLGIVVDRDLRIHCYANDLDVLSAKPKEAFSGGGPAIFAWNPKKSTTITLRSFTIEEVKESR